MPVNTFPIGALNTNCYVIHGNNQAVVVDPGGDPADVFAFLKSNELSLMVILITHMHFDHLFGISALQQAAKTPALTPSGDLFLMETQDGQGGIWGFPKVPSFTSSPVQEGEQHFGAMPCTVIPTPGHTPGSVSFYFPEEEALFCGDVLFFRSIGRSDFTGGDQDTLIGSIREKIFSLPGETRVYPGHGPSTTVADEQQHNPFCGALAR